MVKKTIDDILGELGEDAETVKNWAQSIGDKRVNDGIATYKKKNIDTTELTDRLLKAESAISDIERAADTRFRVYRACQDRDVSFSLIEDLLGKMPEEDILKKVAAIAASVKEKITKDMNYIMVTQSIRPGSGSSRDDSNTLRRRRLAGLSPIEADILERSGELDRMISQER